MSHYEQRLEKDLETIRSEVHLMATKVEQAVENSIHALMTANENLANSVVLGDGPINTWNHNILEFTPYKFGSPSRRGTARQKNLELLLRANLKPGATGRMEFAPPGPYSRSEELLREALMAAFAHDQARFDSVVHLAAKTDPAGPEGPIRRMKWILKGLLKP